ncbi:hypothetical protein DXA08_19450, partial [Blautia obeum]
MLADKMEHYKKEKK